ncbi:lactonase family protein [Radiobacillus kanasensis]|uniref:lactonase family protein n=1 Tax=Radiobacillus kanasensis TaxID=2844358 RepID=UPI001E28E017|nr:lactonase family protein [Radiobacillus kanasensis]UFU00816.1 lactonase family protein [Radiobacillus kanasensis]
MEKRMKGYLGTYTKRNSEGIYSFELDMHSGTIEKVALAAKLERPTYVTLSEDKSLLLSVMKQDGRGGVSVFGLPDKGDNLEIIAETTHSDISSCHISIARGNDYVVVSNYHEGSVELYKYDKEANSIKFVTSVFHEGSGPNKDRQEGPHVHFADFTPDQRYVVVVDLGVDEILTYEIKNDTFVKAATLQVAPGSGPRHLVFHPNGTIAYVMTELSSEVLTLQFDAKTGSFEKIQQISTIPNDFVDNNQGSAIRISKDGKFVYAANRGHNSIAVFQVSEDNGLLSFVEWISTEGDWPRDFNLDPTDQYVVVANQETDSIVLYQRNQATGKLTLKQGPIEVLEPICVMF